MKIMITMFVLILAGGVGWGFYRGWFNVSSDSTEGSRNVTVSVDTDKIKADKNEVVDKVQDLGDKAEDTVEPTPKKTAE